jgi:hypothetical protein
MPATLELTDLETLFIEQLQDLYDSENRLAKVIPEILNAADSSQLQSILKEHLPKTQEHLQRLENVFQQLGQEAKREPCDAMKGLIQEAELVNRVRGSIPLLAISEKRQVFCNFKTRVQSGAVRAGSCLPSFLPAILCLAFAADRPQWAANLPQNSLSRVAAQGV